MQCPFVSRVVRKPPHPRETRHHYERTHSSPIDPVPIVTSACPRDTRESGHESLVSRVAVLLTVRHVIAPSSHNRWDCLGPDTRESSQWVSPALIGGDVTSDQMRADLTVRHLILREPEEVYAMYRRNSVKSPTSPAVRTEPMMDKLKYMQPASRWVGARHFFWTVALRSWGLSPAVVARLNLVDRGHAPGSRWSPTVAMRSDPPVFVSCLLWTCRHSITLCVLGVHGTLPSPARDA